MKTRNFTGWMIVFAAIAAGGVGCQNAYYGTMELFGKHKRDILVDRVSNAREAQNEAKDQFASALEQFSAMADYRGTMLDEKYRTLKAEYERCESKSKAVSDNIEQIRQAAAALFREWQNELEQYTSQSLRQASEAKLKQTRQRYEQLINSMERAIGKTAPVLASFSDQVLFLKHNLNSQAVASLKYKFSTIEQETVFLIRQMEASMAEADAFIREMEGF
jgi:hypothetical protein